LKDETLSVRNLEEGQILNRRTDENEIGPELPDSLRSRAAFFSPIERAVRSQQVSRRLAELRSPVADT